MNSDNSKKKKSKPKKNKIQVGNTEIPIETDTFFLVFIGELVEMAGTFSHAGVETDIKVQGFILDMDDEFYYLGNTPEEIVRAVKRENVVYIEILNPDNEYRAILDEMEVPKDEAEKN